MREEYVPQKTPVPVRIRLADGTSLNGKLLLQSTRAVAEALNGSQQFLEFESVSQERCYIAKSQVLSLTIAEIPTVKSLDASVGDNSAASPYVILGIEQGAAPDAIRQAYLRVTKTYHPDRFASIDLPREVREYLEGMARRINAAYAMLHAEGERAPAARH